ncbi:MAG: hypothetical protein ACKO7R_17350 [Pseudanabaena sp.]
MSESKILTEYLDHAITILQKTIRIEILRMEQGKAQIEQKLKKFEQKYQKQYQNSGQLAQTKPNP